MSQTLVLESVTKTDQEFKGLHLFDVKFKDDSTKYFSWRSDEYPITFKPGDSVSFEITGEDKKDPSKKKIKFVKSTGATQTASASTSTGGGFKRGVDTNRSIMAQTSLKASVDFFKDRPNSSLEDVVNGTRYLLSGLESILNGAKEEAPAAKPAIPTDFLDKLPG